MQPQEQVPLVLVQPYSLLFACICDSETKIFIVTQAEADALPARIGSPYENINSFVLHVNEELAQGYSVQTIQKLATEIEDELEQKEMLQTHSPTGSPNVTASSIGGIK